MGPELRMSNLFAGRSYALPSEKTSEQPLYGTRKRPSAMIQASARAMLGRRYMHITIEIAPLHSRHLVWQRVIGRANILEVALTRLLPTQVRISYE